MRPATADARSGVAGHSSDECAQLLLQVHGCTSPSSGAQPLERAGGPRLHRAAPQAERGAQSPPPRARAGTGSRAPRGPRRAAARARRAGSRAARPRAPSPSGDGAAPPEGASAAAARSASPSRRPAERRRLRASLATICSTQGRNGAPRRKRPRARCALTKPSWAASSASAALRVIRYAVRKAISWWSRTRRAKASPSPRRARSTSSSSVGGRLTTRCSTPAPRKGSHGYRDPMTRLIGINHVALEVGSIDEALAFLERIFGPLELRGRVAGQCVHRPRRPVPRALRRRQARRRRSSTGTSASSSTTKRRSRARLAELGIETLPGRFLDFRDPWGNRHRDRRLSRVQFTKTPAFCAGWASTASRRPSARRPSCATRA